MCLRVALCRFTLKRIHLCGMGTFSPRWDIPREDICTFCAVDFLTTSMYSGLSFMSVITFSHRCSFETSFSSVWHFNSLTRKDLKKKFKQLEIPVFCQVQTVQGVTRDKYCDFVLMSWNEDNRSNAFLRFLQRVWNGRHSRTIQLLAYILMISY